MVLLCLGVAAKYLGVVEHMGKNKNVYVVLKCSEEK